jgi:FkbM family methyltransferase
MVDVEAKLGRIARWRPVVGLAEALRFEFKWSMHPRELTVRVPGYPAPFAIRWGGSDILVFETVFVNRELQLHLPQAPRLIIDGGANIGCTTAYYAKTYPEAKVVAVEPSSDNCRMLRHNCASFPNVSLLEGGLWAESGRLRIADPNAMSWALQCEPAKADDPDSFPAFSMTDILERTAADRCDLLKLDIEGAEEVLFSRNTEHWLPRTNAILVEIHGALADAAVRRACPPSEFSYSQFGEKLLLIRKGRSCSD